MESVPMNRTSTAFLVAPLWVPAVMVPFAVRMFPYPAQGRWIYITVVIAAIFAYGGTLVLGVPAFLLLRARHYRSFGTAAVVGFAIGGLTAVAFFLLLALSLGGTFAGIWREGVKVNFWLLPAACGVLGSIVGATLWLIARPDFGRSD
jgi:hypothetical protein